MRRIKGMLKSIGEKITQSFTAGFLILLPLALTFAAVKIVLGFAVSWFAPLSALVPRWLRCIPHAEVIVGFALISLIGYVLKTFFLERIVHIFEDTILKKIPIVKHFYFGIKQIINIINKTKVEDTEQQVAWVRLPYKGIYCLGFMTGLLDPSIAPTHDKTYYCFFIPTTPNPVTGYYIVASQEDCIFTTLTRQEAMSMVISGGIIRPEKDQK